jgi:tetratricopeptide (TPR) repeat protein
MAQGILSHLSAGAKLKKEATRLLPLVWADYYIKTEEYLKAVPYLQESLKLCKLKDEKSRIYFILGQIKQNANEQLDAYNYYRKCLKMNPPLAMSFNANLNMALCYESGKTDITSTVKRLKKMLLDTKNASYFGRIYYVLGEIAFQNKDDAAAVDYMDKSIDASGNDNERKLLAARRLATYFYDKKDYISAQKYYAIAASAVAPDDEDAYTIKSRAESLAELVQYYTAFIVADTLKIVGNMDEAGQKKYAERKAKEYKAQKERERQRALAAAASATPATASSSNAWYFYNSQSKTVGYNEFVKRWGRRELEDFWFLSDKPRIPRFSENGEDDENGETDGTTKKKDLTPADVEYYLNSLPKYQSDFEKLDSIIEPNLFGVGRVYYDRMNEGEEGEKYLVRLIEEYPGSNFVPAACELLCKIYHERGDNAKFRKYADMLKNNYPNTEQNGRINDPDYFKKLEQSEKIVSGLYEELYNDFSAANYYDVLNEIKEIENNYPVNSFKAQILYIKAIAIGHTQGSNEMKPLLQNFLNEFATHELAPRVSAILASKIELKPNGATSFASNADTTASVASTASSGTSPAQQQLLQPSFTKETPNEKYLIALFYNNAGVRANVLKIRVSDFNRKMFNSDNLSVEIKTFDNDRMIVEVSMFSNKKDAEEYRKTFLLDEYIFGALDKEKNKPEVYTVSEGNYQILLDTKDENSYKQFLESGQ